MNALIVCLAVASLTAKCMADCQINSNTVYTNYSKLLTGLNGCMFNYDNFNADCMLASCKELVTAGVCPYSSNEALDANNVNTIFGIVYRCLKESKTICNSTIDPIPLPEMKSDLLQALTGIPLQGLLSLECGLSKKKGLAQAYNIPQAKVEVASLNQDDSITLNSHLKDLIVAGHSSCNLKINLPLPLLPSLELPSVPLKCIINIDTSSVISIDGFRSKPAAEKPKVSVDVKFDVLGALGLKFPGIIQLVASLVTEPINIALTLIAKLWQGKPIADAAGNFIGNIFAAGFKAAAKTHCKKN